MAVDTGFQVDAMQMFSRTPPVPPPPTRRPASRGHFLAFLILVFLAMRILDASALHRWSVKLRLQPPASAAKAEIWPGDAVPAAGAFYIGGRTVRGAGTPVDLGPAAAPLQGLAAWLFGQEDLVLPSCLTQAPPTAVAGAPDEKLPVRDDLPGFYGAPWTGVAHGDLIALLQLYAPRDPARPADDTTLQIYRHYDGKQSAPDVAADAPVRVFRGRNAVLLRVFPRAPIICIDLVVPTGAPAGTAYLYYRLYQHYFETIVRFAVQK
jgi:hypothetical protein